MPAARVGSARQRSRLSVSLLVAMGLFGTACVILAWTVLRAPNGSMGDAEKSGARTARAPAPEPPADRIQLPPLGRIVPVQSEMPIEPPAPPPQPALRVFGPRTPNSLRAYQPPATGSGLLLTRAEEPAPTRPNAEPPAPFLPPIPLPPVPELPAPAVNPSVAAPPIPTPPPADAPPVVRAPPSAPAPQPPLPSATGGLPPIPKVPEPAPAVVPSVGTTAPAVAEAPAVAPLVPAGRPAPTLLITVPGVALPVPPPRLVPIRRPGQPAVERPPVPTLAAPAAAPQEKLPDPRKLDVPPEAKLRVARARNAVKLGDLPLAITEFEQYLLLVPGDTAIREELAGVYIQAEKFAAAAAAYQELIRLAPANTPRYLVALSDLFLRMKDFKGAIGALRRAIEMLDPNVPAQAAQRYDAAARLARVHLFDEDLPSAFSVIQQFLAALKPGDENVPIRFVSLLLDLERAKEAQPFLEPFLKNLGDAPDAEILINNVRLHALLNDKRKALDGIELLATKLPKSVSARLQLAENLVTQEDFDLAASVFNQISQLQPNHVPSQLAQVRMLIRQFRLTQAKTILETVKPNGPEQILDASLVRGLYHNAAGQYTEAKYFYLDVLNQFPTDPDARLGLGATYEAARDLEKAKAEYSKVPAQSRGWRRARRGLATVLAAQRKTAQAIEVLSALQREAPWDFQTVLAYAQVTTRTGGGAQAAEAAGTYLAGGSPTPTSAAAVEGAMGLALLSVNKVSEAEAAFRSALAASHNKSLVGHYGLLRVSQRLGGGAADMGCPPEFVGDETRYRLVLSDLSNDDYDTRRAFDHASAAMRADPQNLAALIRVADIQQRLARESGIIDDAVATAKTVLVVSPTNVRGHLALARSLAIGKNYRASAEVYQKLISLDAGYTLPKRELARIYFADYRYDLSHDTYLSIISGDPEGALRLALQTISERAPGSAPAIQLLSGPHGQIAGLGPDLARLATTQSDPVVGQAILAALADYEARADEARGAQLEDGAKTQKDLRNRSAVGAYRALVTQEPGNLDALFDLGQVYGTLRQTRESSKVYNELLAADPLSREAGIALERNNAELSPTSRSSVLYEYERGRNGLANMQRFRLSELVTLPLGDQDEFVGAGFSRVNYQPTNARSLDGNIGTFVFQKKAGFDQVLFRSVINYEQYADRLSNRPTGDAGFVHTGDGYVLTASGFLENVVQSSASLTQDIYRYGLRLTGEYQVDRRLDIGGLYRYSYYSDVNNAHEYNVHASYKFTPLPRQLRVIVSADGLFYSSQSVLGPLAPTSVEGTVHPYFAPSGFTYYETRLEWMHQVGRDLFGGSNKLVYVLQYGLGVDNRFNSYNRFRADLNWDVKSWLSVGVAGQYTYSSVYEFGSVFGYITIRLPHIYHL